MEERRGEEKEGGRPFDLIQWMTRQAAGGFITQPGCVVPTLILGPKLWVMNISCDKWGYCNSWSVVGDTFACQQTAVTPPGVWRQRNVQGERACPQKGESLLSSSTQACLLSVPGFACRLKNALMRNAPRLRVLTWRLKRLGHIQTKSRLPHQLLTATPSQRHPPETHSLQLTFSLSLQTVWFWRTRSYLPDLIYAAQSLLFVLIRDDGWTCLADQSVVIWQWTPVAPELQQLWKI